MYFPLLLRTESRALCMLSALYHWATPSHGIGLELTAHWHKLGHKLWPSCLQQSNCFMDFNASNAKFQENAPGPSGSPSWLNSLSSPWSFVKGRERPSLSHTLKFHYTTFICSYFLFLMWEGICHSTHLELQGLCGVQISHFYVGSED